MTTPTINTATAPLPDVVAVLRDNVASLPENDRGFAYSLLASATGRGLSDKQASWVRRLAGRIINPPTTSTIAIGDVAGLIALFDKAAASGLKWPKLRTMTGDGLSLTIRVAGERSRNAGNLQVTHGQQEGRIYFGRVDRAGVFHPSHQPSPEAMTACVAALQAMATDPAAAGRAYGARTGSCAFCSLPLGDSRSVEAGYGPVCAEKWGLPWGDKPNAKKKTARK